MAYTQAFINKIQSALRVKSSSSIEEITDLIDACIADLGIAGVYVTDYTDPMCAQAIKLYVKAHYGYDDESARFRDAYASLKNAMALSGDYPESEES